ncbi:MAG: NAD-dependent epimerase/dehydratase family protein [Ignavibacteria bacterium]|nr:NAD-dependent epimerase/dehydratase family protein [Ignavibacteria bacterium]
MRPDGANCLIFGGGGFIGSHLADELLSLDCNVTIFDKLNFSRRNIEHITADVRIIEGDFNNQVDLENSLAGIDYVFHLVSSTLPANSNENPVYDAETNLLSSLNLFRECVERGVKKLVFLSSGGTVYGIPESVPITEDHPSRPVCSYGIIKKTIEDYLYLFNYLHSLNYVVFRLSNPYGERQNPFASQGAIPVFLNRIMKGEQITVWGDGSVVRDYIYIKDAVKALASSLSHETTHRIFNLSAGSGYSLNELLAVMKEVTGRNDMNVKYEPARNFDVPVSILDNSRIRKELKWKPETSLRDGLIATCNYLKSLND